MPVPTLITELDPVIANNSPAGTESAKGTIDDYFRTHAAFIRQNYNTIQTKADAIQTALDISSARAAVAALIPAGTSMLFMQTSAPIGWTKSTAHDNKALRIVSGAAGSGGSTPFTSVFASRTPAGSVGGTTLTIAQIPSHQHTLGLPTSSDWYTNYGASSVYTVGAQHLAVNAMTGIAGGAAGGGGSHAHGFSGSAMDFSVQYVDAIVGIKN